MDSAPPATTTSASPVWIACAPDTMDCTPVPQSRLTVTAGTSLGMPALMPTTRAMYMSSGAEWMTLPNTIWSTRSRSTPARSSAASTVVAPSSVGGTPLRLLPYEPTAVRAAEEITTSVTLPPEWLARRGRLAGASPLRRHPHDERDAAQQQ